jgi:hypothetical protein
MKQFLRLTTTMAPAKAVLGIRKAVMEKAGVPNFSAELRANGYEVTDKKNMRYLTIYSKYGFSDVCFEGFCTRTLM